MHYSAVVLYFYILTITKISFAVIAPTHLMITHVGSCNDEDLSISVSELSITTQTYDSSLSGTFNISKDIDDGWTVKVTTQKCLDIRNTDSCDYFKSFYMITNGCCEEDDDKQDIYGMLFHYVNPKLDCPVQAGRYEIVNYPFFTEDNYVVVHESKISTSMFGYIYKVDGYAADESKIFCIEASLQLLYIREHDWLLNNKQNSTNRSPKDNDSEK